jgi:hypothetical protein
MDRALGHRMNCRPWCAYVHRAENFARRHVQAVGGGLSRRQKSTGDLVIWSGCGRFGVSWR